MNNVSFSENKLALLFLHITEILEREKSMTEMKESIYYLILKNSALALNGTTANYLYFALISMETEIL